MSRSRSESKPKFFWQALLILLPVGVLAVMGAWSLRQDRVLAEHDAAERAQTIAGELAPRIWNKLLSSTNSEAARVFEVDAAGRLIFPPPCEVVPIPQPLDAGELTVEQRAAWSRAQLAEATNAEAAIAAYDEFLKLNPPARFAASAQYSLGTLLMKKDPAQAAKRFERIIRDYAEAAGESGILFRPLAQLRLLELSAGANPANVPASLEMFCSNIVTAPTFLTPQLLSAAQDLAKTPAETGEVGRWQNIWNEQEAARSLYALARSGLSVAELSPIHLLSVENQTNAAASNYQPRLFWLEQGNWLAIRFAGRGTNFLVSCFSEKQIGQLVSEVVAADSLIPEYFGISIEAGGKRLNQLTPFARQWEFEHYLGKGSGTRKRYTGQIATNQLASASQPNDAADALKVHVLLTSQSALYQQQQARTFWFGALIATASVAALVGLLAAYRAFDRQLRLSEMKSNFVSSVSHELRAPIASVRLLAESLEQGKVAETAKQQEYFRFISQECRRLSSLIENVLDFSRIERGRKQYEFEPTNLSALVGQTVRLMEPYAREREISLREEPLAAPINGQAVQLCIDGKAMQQALVNLIDNAIKHSPRGADVAVGMTLQTVAGNGESTPANSPNEQAKPPRAHLDLWVQDHGEGIPAAEHQRIFERFYRLGSELRRETQGVGIGLSIVKHIVEAHEGRVVVQSEVGKGSRFIIELPIWNAS
jgi:signal transduction histidine kinase